MCPHGVATKGSEADGERSQTDASARLLACHCVAQVASVSFGSIAQCEPSYLDDRPVGTGVHRPVARVKRTDKFAREQHGTGAGASWRPDSW
jgi:hypothetical protein